MALFADDCVLFREVQTREDQLKLQNDLTKQIMWSNRWQVTFNPEKCEVLEIAWESEAVIIYIILSEWSEAFSYCEA